MMNAGWSAKRVARQLGRSDCVVKRCWDQWIREMSFTRRPGLGRPRQTSRREDRKKCMRTVNCFIGCHPGTCSTFIRDPVSSRTIRRRLAEGAWLHLGSRRHYISDDNRVRVWRPRGERLNPAFALQRHTTPAASVMVWGAIAYNTRSPLVLMRSTMTAQRYVHDILQTHVLPLMQWLSAAIFQQDNAWSHTARVSKDGLRTVTTFPWPSRSPNLSPIENIWDHLGRRVGHPTSFNKLGARL
ncbi:transposable element Tcb2 transposase [Trichonephila clavipes]|nr:transposable element Tcb2 transposase [Trichonephila clavipes]